MSIIPLTLPETSSEYDAVHDKVHNVDNFANAPAKL